MQSSCSQQAGASDSRIHTFAALAYRDYRFLWFGVLSMIGGLQMQVVVRGYLTYDLTSSPLKLGLVNTGFAFPMLVLALFGGAVADRVRKKRVIQLCQGLGSVTALFVAVSISTGTVTWVHLLVTSVVSGFIFAFMVPARNAFIPKLVPEHEVSNALALNAAGMSGTSLVAPAIGGSLYAAVGPGGVCYLIAALELAALIFTGLIRAADEPEEASGGGVLRRIADGLAYIKRTPPLTSLLVIALATSLLVIPFRSLLPVLIVDVFHRGPETLGMLLSVMGVGAIVGSLSIASLGKKRRGAILLAGGFTSAAGLLCAAAVPSFGVVIVVMFVLGVTDALRRALNIALLLEQTEPEFRGRVSSVYTMNFGLMPLGTLPAGAIAEAAGVPTTAFVLGVVLLFVCGSVLTSRPAVRRLQ